MELASTCLNCQPQMVIFTLFQGTPPSLYAPIKGDAFALRSDYAMQIDFEEEAPAFKVTDTHWAKTWLLHQMHQQFINQK